MTSGDSKATGMQTFLVPTAVFSPSRFPVPGMLVDSSSLVYPDALNNTQQKQSTFSTSGFENGVSSVKTVPKGRRPKSMATPPIANINPEMYQNRPFCRSCGKFFMSRQQLNQHMLVHTDVRKYKCSYCERSFKQPSHLHQHHRIHTGEKPYKCPIPGCTRAFPQQSNLNHHLRNHDKPAPPPENTCTLCMRTYASETVLRNHIAKIHLCNPDTLIGIPCSEKAGNKVKKSVALVTDGTLPSPPPLQRMSASPPEDVKTDPKMHDINIDRRLVTGQYPTALLPNLYRAPTGIPTEHQRYLEQTSVDNCFVSPKLRNDSYDDVSLDNSSVPNVLDNACPNRNGPQNNDEDKNGNRIAQKYQHRYDFDSNGFVSRSVSEISSNESDRYDYIDYKIELNDEFERFDSNGSANSNPNDSANHTNEQSPVDSSYSSSRSRKRKAFQPQRIVQNKQFVDDCTAP